MTASEKKHLHSKLVFIHELDSVRNSEAEIAYARERLYEEILVNGNTPVISFNQLADSRAFLGLITESAEKAHEAGALSIEDNEGGEKDAASAVSRDSLLNMESLMKEGRIRIVRFGKKRTASQYLQENLDPDKAKEEDQFILSGWPIPSDLSDAESDELIESIRLALKYSDLDYLDRHSGDEEARAKAGFKGSEVTQPVLSDGQLRPLRQLVEFMLFISKTKFAYADINPGTKPRLADILELVIDRIESGKIAVADFEVDGALLDACKNLRHIRCAIEEDSPRKTGKRSAWHNALREDPVADPPVKRLSFMIVDLCYNMTIEAGIDRCSHFMNPADDASFNSAISAKLSEYVTDYAKYRHTYKDGTRFGLDDQAEGAAATGRLDWGLAVNIQQALGRRFERHDDKSCVVETYSSGLQEQRVQWRRNVYGALGFQTLGALLYVVLFAFIEIVMSLIDNLIENAGKTVLASDAPGIEDMFTFNRTIAVSAIFLIGVVAYALLTRNGRFRSIKVPMIGIAAIFFVIMPVLACIDIVPIDSGMPEIRLELGDFIDNFAAMLPSLLVGLVAVVVFASIGSLLEERTGVPALFDSMRLTKGSIVDSWKFWHLTRKGGREGVSDSAGAGAGDGVRDGAGDVVNDAAIAGVGETDGADGSTASVDVGASSANMAGVARHVESSPTSHDSGISIRPSSIGYPHSVIPTDPWAKLFGDLEADNKKVSAVGRGVSSVDTQAPADGEGGLSRSGSWDEYVDLVKAHDGDSAADPSLEIVLDEREAKTLEGTNGKDIGIVYDSPYNTLVVDLVRDPDGNEFTYERLIPKSDSGVVIVPVHDGKFVLLDQFRHSIRRRQLAFPRGFGEKGLNPRRNACKELKEELGVDVDEADMKPLGKLTPDSGISANVVSVFWCEIGDYSITEGNESILGVCELTEDELRATIARGAGGTRDDSDGDSVGIMHHGDVCTTTRSNGGIELSSNSTAPYRGVESIAAIGDKTHCDDTNTMTASNDKTRNENGTITDGFTLAAFSMWLCHPKR